MSDFNTALAEVKNNSTTLAQAMTGQRMQEIQAMVFMAKQFPRDEFAAIEKIKTACGRKDLADGALYTYPRGGQIITGPSIRLAEVIVQNWGNIKSGVIELDNSNGESKAMSYAWDIETNTYDEKIFSVKHIRDTKQGAKTLTENRDIYETVANMAARRKRACILAVIPAWVIKEAEDICKATLLSNTEPLVDRLRKLFDTFKTRHGVTKEMIEKYKGYSVESFTEEDGLELKGIFNALKEGAKKEDYFDFASTLDSKLEQTFKQKAAESKKEPDIFDQIKDGSK